MNIYKLRKNEKKIISVFCVILNCKTLEMRSKFKLFTIWRSCLLHFIQFAMCRRSTFRHHANFLKIAKMQSLSCKIYDANATKLVSFPGSFDKHNGERHAYSLCFCGVWKVRMSEGKFVQIFNGLDNIFHFTWFICYLHFAQFISRVICLNNT